MLRGVKVVELSSSMTMMAGRILADFGAEVICVEPPGGASGRRLAPFANELPGLENSLTWHGCNQNKFGITIDRSTLDGRTLLKELVNQANILIEEVPSGRQELYSASERPRNLVHCIIRAFDPKGPKSHYTVTDPVLVAAGGSTANNGLSGNPPLFFPVPQAMMEVGGDAAIAALGAFLGDEDGGQRVEVIGRIATTLSSFDRILPATDHKRTSRQAEAGFILPGVPAVPSTFACSDGLVIITIALIPPFRSMVNRIADWAHEAGGLPSELAKLDWVETAQAISRGEADADILNALITAVQCACKDLSWRTVVEKSQAYGFMAAPILSMRDIAEFDQYRHRGLFAPTKINGRNIDLPIRVAQFENYRIEVLRPAPKLGEHNVEIYSSRLGLSTEEVHALFAHGVI